MADPKTAIPPAGVARPGVLSLNIREKAALYAAYMPFLKGGGIFIPTSRSYVLGEDVTLVSSAEETAKDVYRVLATEGLLRPDDLPGPEHRFLVTGDPGDFGPLARRFLGPEIGWVERAGAFA